ncbi:hypothetical protein P691DRAFT_639282, partial [Macrolepiota fuliginosa MF-IS2]
AEMDSSSRHPPPKCHPATRQALRERVITWFANVDGALKIFWILGPRGIGKSAIAQTIAEYYHDLDQLGAAFFFSNHASNSLQVIPTLVYQLVIRFPDYKRIIIQILNNDSTIFERNLRSQFKSLIVKPFTMLQTQNSACVQQPILFILDGLDECQPEVARCELIELIDQSSLSSHTRAFRWLIFSRPDPSIQRLASRSNPRHECEELRMDDADARHDVSCMLQDGFASIRQQYSDVLDETWPPEAQLRRLADGAGGSFPFASTALELV